MNQLIQSYKTGEKYLGIVLEYPEKQGLGAMGDGLKKTVELMPASHVSRLTTFASASSAQATGKPIERVQ